MLLVANSNTLKGEMQEMKRITVIYTHKALDANYKLVKRGEVTPIDLLQDIKQQTMGGVVSKELDMSDFQIIRIY